MNYQLTVLISNKLDEKKRGDLLADVEKSLGSKSKKDLWGVRGLAYPIKHEEKAYYAHFDFEVEPGLIPEIDRKLKLNEEIVRYLLIKVDPKIVAKAAKPAASTAKTDKKEESKTDVKAEAPKSEKEADPAEESSESK